MDYVIGYFRDSQARQFALTPRGWVQWQDGKWGPPLNRGHEVEGCVLHMAEAGDGTLFAQGERQLLALRNNKWQVVDRQTTLVTATRKGEIIAACRDDARGLLWFSVWDGEKFNVVSDGWVRSDRELLLPLIYERAAAYAKEKGITPREDVTN